MRNVELDEQDQAILDRRVKLYNQKEGPRVGDFVMLKGEDKPRRFICEAGTEHLQVTDKGAGGSFYLGEHDWTEDKASVGYIRGSGACGPGILKTKLLNSGQTRTGRVWFFSHDISEKDNGVDVDILFRVFVQV
jgi:hypothetical protein